MQSYAAVISVMERVSDRCWIHGHQRLRVNVCEGFSRKHTCQSTDNNEEDEDVVDDDDDDDDPAWGYHRFPPETVDF